MQAEVTKLTKKVLLQNGRAPDEQIHIFEGAVVAGRR
jgi:hypothetical protein